MVFKVHSVVLMGMVLISPNGIGGGNGGGNGNNVNNQALTMFNGDGGAVNTHDHCALYWTIGSSMYIDEY